MKVTLPPGSAIEVGLAALIVAIDGATSVMVTVASSVVARLGAVVVDAARGDGVGLARAGVAADRADEGEGARAAGASTVPTSQSASPTRVP